MCSEINSKLANIVDIVNSQIKCLPDNENLHPMEMDRYVLSKVFDRFQITSPIMSMMTVRFLLPNYYFNNCTLFDFIEVGEKVEAVVTKIDRKIRYKSMPNVEIPNDAFNSQITFNLRSDFSSVGTFKVKFFNSVDGMCELQVPGVKDVNQMKTEIIYLKNYINRQIKNKHISHPEIGDPIKEEIIGYSSRSMLRLPVGMTINFTQLIQCFNEVMELQRENGKNKKIRTISDPCTDLVWPLCDVGGNIGRKKCWIYIFTPIYGCDDIKHVRVEFASKAKNIDINNINGVDMETCEYSILFFGRSQIRHRRYIYYFLWEFFGRYQSRLFYNEKEFIQNQFQNDYEADIQLLEFLEANDYDGEIVNDDTHFDL